MAIKKDEQTGWWNIFYRLPTRTKRRRYQKAPTVLAKTSIFGFLKDLFRGGPNPFLASPIALAIDRRVQIEKQAKIAAKNSSKDAAKRLIRRIHTTISDYFEESDSKTDTVLDDLKDEVDEEELILDSARPKTMVAELDHELRKILDDFEDEFTLAANELIKREKELEQFIGDHELNRKRATHWGTEFTRNSLYFIIGITLFEFVLNAMFFSGTQRTGLIGGAALAILLSIVTIAFGVGFGLAYQFSDSRADGGGWRGRIFMVVLSVATLFYLLMLTLARHYGELGDPNLYETVAREIQSRPFSGLLDLPAFAYFVFSIGVIFYVTRKFVAVMGHFPRIRGLKLGVDREEKELADLRAELTEDLEQKVDEFMASLDDVPEKVHARKMALRQILTDHENAVDQFKADIEKIRDASDLLIDVVRQYIQAPEEDFSLGIDFDRAIRDVDKRHANFTKRVEALLGREEASPVVVDQCKAKMAAMGKRERKALEDLCDRLRDGSARNVSASRRSGAQAQDNVAWLVKGGTK